MAEVNDPMLQLGKVKLPAPGEMKFVTLPPSDAGREPWRRACESGRQRCENFLRGLTPGSPMWVMIDAIKSDIEEALRAGAAGREDGHG